MLQVKWGPPCTPGRAAARGVWCELGVCVRHRGHGRAGRCRGEVELTERMRGEGWAGHPLQAGIRGASPGANPPVETGRGLSPCVWAGHGAAGAEAPSRRCPGWRDTCAQCSEAGAGGTGGGGGRLEESAGLARPVGSGWCMAWALVVRENSGGASSCGIFLLGWGPKGDEGSPARGRLGHAPRVGIRKSRGQCRIPVKGSGPTPPRPCSWATGDRPERQV